MNRLTWFGLLAGLALLTLLLGVVLREDGRDGRAQRGLPSAPEVRTEASRERSVRRDDAPPVPTRTAASAEDHATLLLREEGASGPIAEDGRLWGWIEVPSSSPAPPFAVTGGRCHIPLGAGEEAMLDLLLVELERGGRQTLRPTRLRIRGGSVHEVIVEPHPFRGRVAVLELGSGEHVSGLGLFHSPTGTRSEVPTRVATDLASPVPWREEWRPGFYFAAAGERRSGRFAAPVDGMTVETFVPGRAQVELVSADDGRRFELRHRSTPRRPWEDADAVDADLWELPAGRCDLELRIAATEEVLAELPNLVLEPGERRTLRLDALERAARTPARAAITVHGVPAEVAAGLRVELVARDVVGAAGGAERSLLLTSGERVPAEEGTLRFAEERLAPGEWQIRLAGFAAVWIESVAPGGTLTLDVDCPAMTTLSICLVDGATGQTLPPNGLVQVYQSQFDRGPELSPSGLSWEGGTMVVASCDTPRPTLCLPLWVRADLPGYRPFTDVFDVGPSTERIEVRLTPVPETTIELPWPRDLDLDPRSNATVRARHPLPATGNPSAWIDVPGRLAPAPDGGWRWTGRLPTPRPLAVELAPLYRGRHPGAVVRLDAVEQLHATETLDALDGRVLESGR